MPHLTQSTPWVTLLVSLAMVAAACGSDPAADTAAPGLSEPVRIDEFPAAEKMNRLLAECMRSKGWEVTLENDDRGVVFEAVADDQISRQDEDNLACQQEIVESGVLPDPRRPPSEELVRLRYDSQVSLAQCLADNGYPIPETPSWQTYYDNARRGGYAESEGAGWNPMSLVHAAAAAGDEQMREDATVDCLEEEE